MRAATNLLLLAGAALAIAACQDNQAEQNITIDNEVAANADIEALPPDETVETPTNELANGADNAADVNASTNSY